MATALMPDEERIAADPVNVGIGSIESGGSYEAANPESSARGKYQFIRSTFEGVQKNNPDLPKISWDEFQKSPDAQEKYQAALRSENQNALKKRGLDVTPSNEYIMHWAGAPKGAALLKAGNDQTLSEFFSPEVLKKNRLSGDMSVGEFKTSISDKMMSKMGKGTAGAGRGGQGGPTSEQLGVPKITSEGVVSPAEAEAVSSGTGFAPVQPKLTLEQNNQLKELEKLTEKIANIPQGTPEHNIAVAEGLKKQYGPNWTNAFISALFGNKDQALTWITGGKNHAPQIGEGIVNGVNRQVWINRNDRGDVWYTDPSSGARLPDNTVITVTTPEGSITTSQARSAAQVAPGAPGAKFSYAETEAHKGVGALVSERSQGLYTEGSLLSDINSGTKKFSNALNNAIRGPNAEAFVRAINSIKGGLVDEARLKEAATLAGIDPADRGEFQQFLRNIASINKLDSSLTGKHAPGAGAHGVLDIEGGSKGIQQWLANRSSSYALQDAWNNYYEQNKNNKTVQQITNEFRQTDTYVGIQNYKKLMLAKMSGKSADLVDGDPVVDYGRNGKLVMKKYNAKTGKAE